MTQAEIKVFYVQLPEPCITLSGVHSQMDQNSLCFIYPNPTIDGLVIIKYNNYEGNDNMTISVNDMVGKKVYYSEGFNCFENHRCVLNLGFLSNGMYFMTLKWKDKIISKPIIINQQNLKK